MHLFMRAFINMYDLSCNILSLKLYELCSLATLLKPNDLSNKISFVHTPIMYRAKSSELAGVLKFTDKPPYGVMAILSSFR